MDLENKSSLGDVLTTDTTQQNLTGVDLQRLFTGFNFTVTPKLTSTLSGTNIDFTKSATEILSAVSSYFTESIRTVTQKLSTPVIHPYDAVKMSLFETDYKFPTIDEVVVPEEIDVETIKETINEHTQTYKKRILDYTVNQDKYKFVGPFDHVSVLSEPSGTDCFVVSQDKYKNYIETVEIIRSIKPENITEENCSDYIKKINYCIASMLSRRTV